MKAFVSVLGMDKKGIIKDVSAILSDYSINILDLNQTIVQGYFTMVMCVDLSDMEIELTELKEKLNVVASNLDLKIRVQHEDIFNTMHKI